MDGRKRLEVVKGTNNRIEMKEGRKQGRKEGRARMGEREGEGRMEDGGVRNAQMLHHLGVWSLVPRNKPRWRVARETRVHCWLLRHPDPDLRGWHHALVRQLNLRQGPCIFGSPSVNTSSSAQLLHQRHQYPRAKEIQKFVVSQPWTSHDSFERSSLEDQIC